MLPHLDIQAAYPRLERSLAWGRAERRARLIESVAGSPGSRGPRWRRAGRVWSRFGGRLAGSLARPILALLLLLVGRVADGDAAVINWSHGTLAQDATPATATETELRVTITDTGFDVSAESVPAGQVRLTVENRTSEASGTGDTADADLLLPPTGISVDAVLADIAAINAAALGTPTANVGSPVTGSGLPAWIYQATWAGGPLVPPGETVEVTVTLAAGTWILFNGSFGTPQQPTTVEVTGSAVAADEPRADAAVTLAEYAFGGLATRLPAGAQTWKITNVGAQPHFMAILKAPTGITVDEMMEILENGGPSPDGPYAEADFDLRQPGLGLLSRGQTGYLTLDLEPGTYVAVCWVPDLETGVPHLMMGMIQLFEVGGAATGTPAA